MFTGRIDRRLKIGLTAVGALAVIAAAGWLATRHVAPRPVESCLASDDRPVAPGAGMVWIPGGRFRMGSDRAWPEEAPVREAEVAGFWIDTHDVTNAQFARFVRETGYVTVAERTHEPGARLGAMVFSASADIQDLTDISQWWHLDPDADWRHPEGRGSSLAHRQNHPVVQVAYEDAVAYARWAGKDLPTEAQWERAARGGRDGATFTWGDEPDSMESPRADVWRGVFPAMDLGSKGFTGTAPVGCFPPNGFGLYDMTGNVWQWTRDAWTPDHDAAVESAEARVIKGGSFLCAANYCLRYRPAARQPGDMSTGAAHLGFRTVRAGPP